MEKNKSAADIMQNIVFGAVVDSISALKADSGGMPNSLARDIAAINANITFADLPKSVQQSVRLATQSSFNLLLKNGYVLVPKSEVKPRGRKSAG